MSDSTTTRTVTKALAVEEDILYGEGPAQQTRGGVSTPVTKVSGFRPVNTMAELLALDIEKFPKAVLVINGTAIFYQHNGTDYEQLIPLSKQETISVDNAAISVATKETIIFNVATPHLLTSLNDGIVGQRVTLISKTANTTVQNNTNMALKGAADYLIPINTGITLEFIGTIWSEV
jgi:hypothetical protein